MPTRRRAAFGSSTVPIVPSNRSTDDGAVGISATLPASYDLIYDRMLANVADAVSDSDAPLVPFWPLRGAGYDAELLVIGRSVNGWIDEWTALHLRDPVVRRGVVASMRADAEPENLDRMAWVTDLWGASTGYNTRRSAFWRVIRRLSTGDGIRSDWPSSLAWTNLYKVSPAEGWNPGADLQRAQRGAASELLQVELSAFSPRRVLALTGGWIAPFADDLELVLDRRASLVESVGSCAGRAWVIAKHPMRKPEDAFVEDVRNAFAGLGVPLPATDT